MLPLAGQAYGDNGLVVSRLVNLYVQNTPEGPTASARYPRPGLAPLVSRGSGPVRLTVSHNGYRFTVSGSSVYRDGVVVGSIPGRGLVRAARSDDQLVMVYDGKAYLVNATVVQITDPDLPKVKDVAFCGGRFVYVEDYDGSTGSAKGRFHWSAIGSAASIDGLDFATAEGNPDDIVSVRALGDELFFFGEKTIETWYPTGDIDAPFQRSPGRRSDKGLVGQAAVCDLDNAHFWVGTNQDDGQTDLIVYRNSAAPARVSTSAVERLIRQTTDAASITLIPAVVDGHSFLLLNIPGVCTQAYDVGNDRWSEWASFGLDTFRAQVADGGVFGDSITGQLWTLDPDRRTDGNDPVVLTVTAFAPLSAGKANNTNVCLHTQPADGVVEMRYSDNGDDDWSEYRQTSLDGRALWFQLGLMRSPGRTYEFRCSDDVRFVPYGVTVNEPVL